MAIEFFQLLAISFTTANVGLLTAIFFKLGRIEGVLQGTAHRLDVVEKQVHIEPASAN